MFFFFLTPCDGIPEDPGSQGDATDTLPDHLPVPTAPTSNLGRPRQEPHHASSSYGLLLQAPPASAGRLSTAESGMARCHVISPIPRFPLAWVAATYIMQPPVEPRRSRRKRRLCRPLRQRVNRAVTQLTLLPWH